MTGKILIIDDEEMVVRFLERIFFKEGLSVLSAKNAEEGVKILRENDGDFQVIFLDLILPDRDGVDFCKELKPKYPASVFFAITGYSPKYTIESCRIAGFDDYFTKPFEIEVVVGATIAAIERVQRWKRIN